MPTLGPNVSYPFVSSPCPPLPRTLPEARQPHLTTFVPSFSSDPLASSHCSSHCYELPPPSHPYMQNWGPRRQPVLYLTLIRWTPRRTSNTLKQFPAPNIPHLATVHTSSTEEVGRHSCKPPSTSTPGQVVPAQQVQNTTPQPYYSLHTTTLRGVASGGTAWRLRVMAGWFQWTPDGH